MMISDKDEWPLHHSPSQSSHGHHDRQDSNEKIGTAVGIYGSIAPALPPSVSSHSNSGSIRRNLTMTSSHSNGALAVGAGGGAGGLNRADSMASSAHGGIARSDSGHYQQQQQQQQYQGFYPGLPPPPPMPQVGQTYHHQGYAPQYGNNTGGGLDYSTSIMRGHGNAGLNYSNSMRRPGGYEY